MEASFQNGAHHASHSIQGDEQRFVKGFTLDVSKESQRIEPLCHRYILYVVKGVPTRRAPLYNGAVMMHEIDRRFFRALRRTRVVRPPRQALSTFGTTAIHYYLVTAPVYTDVPGLNHQDETVVREGTVHAERPQVVTPYYLMRHEGFGENASRYLEEIMSEYGPDAPGLLYSYRNDPAETSIVSGRPRDVARRISERLEREQRGMEAVIQGVDEMWDVSLMKFIYELTDASVLSNAAELEGRGLLEMEDGVPRDARRGIEALLERARRGSADPSEVHRELERWGLFDEYQDHFLGLFRSR